MIDEKLKPFVSDETWEKGFCKGLFLELFSGTGTLSQKAKDDGWAVFRIDYDKRHDADLYEDIGTLTAQDIIEKFGHPDVVWASPDCTTFSVAAIGYHRKRDEKTGNLIPKTEYAKKCDEIDKHVIKLIESLAPTYWFIENPRGAMRKMSWMQGLPRFTITFCKYGLNRMKPTDIWTNHPNPRFEPPCKNGDKCHVPAPRGSRTGTQGIQGSVARSKLPDKLCEHIVEIMSEEWRVCDVCGCPMDDGYLIHEHEYYCSDDCLHSMYSADEYDELCQADEGYWTQWY